MHRGRECGPMVFHPSDSAPMTCALIEGGPDERSILGPKVKSRRRGVPRLYLVPLSLPHGEGDTEPVLSSDKSRESYSDLPKKGEVFPNSF